MTGVFISDLHLFSRRSIGQQHWDRNRALITDARAIVLGGDMFDLRWSQYSSLKDTLAAADRWLESAIALNPGASWSYLLGNHDCHPLLQTMLQQLGQRHANFKWSATHLQIGQNVFLHGDVLDGMRNAGGIDQYRSHFHETQPRGPVKNLLYSAVIQTRLHGVVPRFRHTRRQTCRRLIRYLETCESELLPNVSSIYFGHTHIPMTGYRFDRFRFFNAGSGIRYSPFTPAIFEVS